jgi:hypothetical protein
MIKKSLLTSSIILLSIYFSFGQTITNSPYTRFGIGEIDRGGFGMNRAMGSLSTGLRKQNQINYLNPASFSAQDTMSFIFDVGISGTSKTLSNNTLSTEYQNFYFDHLAISFPLQRWWFTSIGIVPYSRIGYNIQSERLVPELDTVNAINNYYGNGGINQVYLGNSFVIFKGLSLGINLSYLFGSLEQYNVLSLDLKDSYSTINTNKITLNKFTYDIGLQYNNMIGEKYFYNIGFVYSSKIKFNGTNKSTTLMAENFIYWDINILDYLAISSNLADTITSKTINNYKVEIPAKYSFGFSSGIKDKLTLGFDFSMQDWSNIESLNLSENFAKDMTYNFGIEYIPNKFALRNYFNLINYRAGFYYNTGYLKFDNNQISTYGITFGVGLPITNKTSINLFGMYGQRGTLNNDLVKEEFYLFGINLTLYDFWFYKSKFQ